MEVESKQEAWDGPIEDTKVLNSIVNDDHEIFIKILKYKEIIGEGCFLTKKKPIH